MALEPARRTDVAAAIATMGTARAGGRRHRRGRAPPPAARSHVPLRPGRAEAGRGPSLHVQPLVDIMNHAEPAAEGELLAALQARDAHLADEVRSKMLAFEDLPRLAGPRPAAGAAGHRHRRSSRSPSRARRRTIANAVRVQHVRAQPRERSPTETAELGRVPKSQVEEARARDRPRAPRARRHGRPRAEARARRGRDGCAGGRLERAGGGVCRLGAPSPRSSSPSWRRRSTGEIAERARVQGHAVGYAAGRREAAAVLEQERAAQRSQADHLLATEIVRLRSAAAALEAAAAALAARTAAAPRRDGRGDARRRGRHRRARARPRAARPSRVRDRRRAPCPRGRRRDAGAHRAPAPRGRARGGRAGRRVTRASGSSPTPPSTAATPWPTCPTAGSTRASARRSSACGPRFAGEGA